MLLDHVEARAADQRTTASRLRQISGGLFDVQDRVDRISFAAFGIEWNAVFILFARVIKRDGKSSLSACDAVRAGLVAVCDGADRHGKAGYRKKTLR